MKKTLIAVSLTLSGASAFAQPGYVMQSSSGSNLMAASGACVHSGYWSQEMAAAPCDAAPMAALPMAAAAPAPMQPMAAAAAGPQPAPAPMRAEPQPMAERISERVALSADVLFEFGKATLKEEGRQALDALATRLQGANLDEMMVVGHSDRIGSEQYNRRLSEARASAVMEYMRSRSSAQAFRTAGVGEREPVTGASCQNMGRESGANRRLVQCLQPDRRVEIRLSGTRMASPTGTVPSDAARGSTVPASLSR